jgi:hypothetical protein
VRFDADPPILSVDGDQLPTDRADVAPAEQLDRMGLEFEGEDPLVRDGHQFRPGEQA